ncbi:MAG TPA: condensation domain-containing protein, partial [Actinophytocola sp.]|nr:condensation domain-containing protein [Actinophytocola sp.]
MPGRLEAVECGHLVIVVASRRRDRGFLTGFSILEVALPPPRVRCLTANRCLEWATVKGAMSHYNGLDLPLTAAQAEMWVAQKVDTGNPMYNIAECVEIHGPVKVELFEAALRQVISEADALRVRFRPDGDTLRQVVAPELDWSLPYLDFGGEDDPAAAAERWMVDAAAEPVDLLTDALFTFALLRVDDASYRWFIRLHHALADGYSSALVTARCAEVYTALVSAEPVPETRFGPLADLVEWAAAYRDSAEYTRDRAYWLDRFTGAAEPATLAGRRPTRVPATHERLTGTLSDTDGGDLRGIARESGVAWPVVVAAGIAAYLHQLTGRGDIVLGFAVAARTGKDCRHTPGMVSNTVPLLLSVRPGMTVLELLEQTSAELRRAIRHQRYRMADLHRDLGLVGDRKRLWGPEINVLLYGEDPSFAGRPGTVRGFSVGPEEDLTLVVDGRSGTGIKLDLHANPDLYDGESLAGHRDRLVALLRDLGSGDHTRPVALLDPAEAGERREVGELVADRRSPVESTVDQLLSTPSAGAAVVWQGTEIGRTELDAKANRLARRLIQAGMSPERVVAIAGPPSPEQVLALLAVVRAGTACLPVDALADAAGADLVLVTGSGDDNDLPAGTPVLRLTDPGLDAELAAHSPDPVTDADRVTALRPAHPVLLDDGGRLVVTHAAAVAWLEVLRARSGDRVTCHGSAWEPLLALATGATAVIADQPGTDPAGFADPRTVAVTGAGEARVLDSALRPALPAVPGGLYLTGALVPRGHVDATRTATSLVADPYGPPGSRMYLLTDGATQTAGGAIEVPDHRTAEPATAPEQPVRRAPSGRLEEVMCQLFAEVLGLTEVGVEDDFFALGAQSLTAIRLANRIRSTFGVEMSLRSLFELRTAAAIAAHVTSGTGARPGLRQMERPDRVPLSLLQQGLWFINRTDGASGMYNTGLALRLTGALDRAVVHQALTDVVRRHESLRTVFPEADDGKPFQRILDPADVSVSVSVADVDAAGVDRALTGHAEVGFDLTTDLPIRGHLLVLSPTEHVLLIILHHIAGDGWSLVPLGRDFETAYRARSGGRVPEFAALPLQYADYSLWQRENLGAEADQDSALHRQLNYWRTALAGLPEELELPRDRPRPATPSYTGGTVRFEFGPAAHRALADLALRHRASTFMALRGLVATMLTRIGAGTDIPLGMAVTGRTDDLLDGVVGCFINTLVFRTDTAGSPSFAELLRRVRESDLGAYANQDVPFHRLVDVLNPARSLNRNPLFQVMLDVQEASRETVSLPGLEVTPQQIEPGTAKVDLLFGFEEHRAADGTPAGVRGRLEFSHDLFEPG